LNDGSEVRGVVMSKDPAAGVVLRLVDGTTRTFPAANVVYVGLQGTGGLYIEGEEPAKVTLQDEVEGRTPFTMTNLAGGTYRVKVEFDGGGTVETEIGVHVGRIERVNIPLPEIRRLSKDHGWAFAAGPLLGSSEGHGLYGFDALVGHYFALSPTLEVRISAGLGIVMIEDFTNGPEFFVNPAFRVNLSPAHAMEFGLQLGATTTGYVPDDSYDAEGKIEGALGVRLSFVSLRFGEHRQYEVTLWHSACILLSAGQGQVETGVSFAFLTL
jgi:hypothetical protein